jgi:hypothetical protein
MAYRRETVEFGQVKCDVFQAKDWRKPNWNSTELRSVVESARNSYRVYSDEIPLVDEYDKKSSSYVAKMQGDGREKSYSLRFVPAVGEPNNTEDLDFYVYHSAGDKQPVGNIIGDKLRVGKDQIFSLSRVCATATTTLSRSSNDVIFDLGFAFKLMCNAFVDDNPQARLVTCQMHDGLWERVALPGSPAMLAEDVLGIEKGTIVIDRHRVGVYAYRFPSYFLNQIDLERVIAEYAPRFLPLARANLIRLGELLNSEGEEEAIALRAVLDREVADGPKLRLIQIDGINSLFT